MSGSMNFNDSLKYNLCMKPLQIATIEDILRIQDDLGLREELELRKAQLIQMAVCEFLEDKPDLRDGGKVTCVATRCPKYNDGSCVCDTQEE